MVVTVATAGIASPFLAGAIVGASAGFTAGAVGTWTNGGSFLEGFGNGLLQGAIGAVSGAVGAGVGKWASKGLGDVVIQGFNVVNHVAKGAIAGALGGAAGGYAGSFVAGAIATGSLKDAHQAGLSGLALGAGIGALSGGAAGYKTAKSQGINPWTGADLGGNSLGAGRSAAKQWIQEAGTMDRGQMIKDIQSAGFQLKTPAKSPVQVFERGGMRIRLDPIQRGTPYNHMHLEYGGNSYDKFLNPVNYRSPAAHIPIR